MNRKLIAITGGIGSGKSVVSRILRIMGYEVYDSDSRAKALMDADELIKQRLASDIAREVIDDAGAIDRQLLSQIVFADAAMLARLNAIVHEAVRRDIMRWQEIVGDEVAFVETALLFQSGLNRIVDAEWRVDAPEALRIERVMLRNSLSREQVAARIASQAYTPAPGEPEPPCRMILNDGIEPLLPQILAAVEAL